MRLCSLVLTLLLPIAGQAAPPPLSVPAAVTAQPGQFLKVVATTPGKTVKWTVLDPGLALFPVELLADSHTAVVSGTTPGTYRLLAVTAAADEVSEPAICAVTIAGTAPNPTPAPGPTPQPTPAPAPVSQAAWAILVVDNSARTAEVGRLVGSPTLPGALGRHGVRMAVYDVHDPTVVGRNYAPYVQEAGGAPALLILGQDGRRLKSLRLPADEVSLIKEVAP